MCWLVKATQSIIFLKSAKSPMPKLSSVFNEKTGIEVPIPLNEKL